MLKKIEIENFRSVKQESLNLRKINILIGPNGSGKSSLLYPLALLRYWSQFVQSKSGRSANLYIRALEDDLPSLFNALGNYQDWVFKREKSSTIHFNISFAPNPEVVNKLQNMIEKIDNKRGEYNPDPHQITYELRFCTNPYQQNPHNAEILEQCFRDMKGRQFARIQNEIIYRKDGGYSSRPKIEPHLIGNQEVQLDPTGFLDIASERNSSDNFIFSFIKELTQSALQAILSIQFLMESRVPYPRYSELQMISRDESTEPFDIPSQLAHWHGKKEKQKIEEKIRFWMKEFGAPEFSQVLGPAWPVKQDGVNRNIPTTYGEAIDPELHIPLNLASFGSGTQQMAYVIAQCYYSDPGTTIIITEPEQHLNPEMQLKLIDLFKDVIDWGNQIIFTTHSDILLYRIQELVAKGELSPKDIGMYHIVKNNEGTHAEELLITEMGDLPKRPPSYADASKKAIEGLLKEQRNKRDSMSGNNG